MRTDAGGAHDESGAQAQDAPSRLPRALGYRVGITGHQALGSYAAVVAEQCRAVLADALRREGAVTALSSLAVGADTLFAQAALDLGIPLQAVIPCKRYALVFAAGEVRQHFYDLRARARMREILSAPGCTEEAYLAAGQWIVEHCDLLVAAWDQQPARGVGGTADIVSYARARGVPIHLIPVAR